MKSLFEVATSALLIAAPPPSDAATKADVRCFIALSALADTGDETTKQMASAGVLYFLGRLDGRSPALDIVAAVEAELPISEAGVNSLLKSCGTTIKGRGDHLIAVGKTLEEREGKR